MKSTIANVTKYVKGTIFVAISFNADGSRATHYGGGNPLMVLHFMSVAAKNGKRALLFPNTFQYRDVYKKDLGVLECSACSQKDPNFYETVLPFAISSQDFYY